MLAAIYRFLKTYPRQNLAVFTCPVLCVCGGIAATCGKAWGFEMFMASFGLLLPMGIICLLMSWFSHRRAPTGRDSDDLMEFLLGFAGILMIVVGIVLFAPSLVP